MSDEEYIPATRPPGAPGGDRVRFESEGGVEQSMFGGSAADIERSIMEDTAVNINILGCRIMSVRTVKNDLGAGELREIEMTLSGGPILRIAWTEQGLIMAVRQ